LFKREDFLLAKALKQILDDGTFPLKAREVQAFAAVHKWAGNLDLKIEKYLQEEKMKPIEPEKPKKKKKVKK